MTATFPLIDRLITKEAWGLQAGNRRYCNGSIWVFLAPNPYTADTILHADGSGDMDSIAAWEWFESMDWLPLATSLDGFTAALATLEARLRLIPEELLSDRSRWGIAVNAAVEQFNETTRVSKYGCLESDLPRLPATLQDVLASTWPNYD